MTKTEYQEYLQTDHWCATREWALERAEHRCQVCARKQRLEVHHNNYDNLNHERPADLIVLCHECHSLYHNGGCIDDFIDEVKKMRNRLDLLIDSAHLTGKSIGANNHPGRDGAPWGHSVDEITGAEDFLASYPQGKIKKQWSNKDVNKTAIALSAVHRLGISDPVIARTLETYTKTRTERGIYNHHKPYNFLFRLACNALEDVVPFVTASGIPLEKAWDLLVEDPTLPKGVAPFLRAANVSFPQEGGEVGLAKTFLRHRWWT